MLDSILGSTSAGAITPASFLVCTAASVLLGAAAAGIYMFRNIYTKSFVVTIAMLPVAVQVVIMLVSGNLGAGVAIAGAFSLIRFRSVPGSAKDICTVFFTMAIGFATGMGYVGIAVLMTAVFGGLVVLYTVTGFGEGRKNEKELRISIPESLDYTEVFDDLFLEFTQRAELLRVKTTNMGSLYQLTYHIVLKDTDREKEFLDQLRCRNGNLDILCGRVSTTKEEL